MRQQERQHFYCNIRWIKLETHFFWRHEPKTLQHSAALYTCVIQEKGVQGIVWQGMLQDLSRVDGMETTTTRPRQRDDGDETSENRLF
jgi:hypothetical protein